MKIIAAVDASKGSELVVQTLAGMSLAKDSEVKLLMVIKSDESEDNARQKLDAYMQQVKSSAKCAVDTDLSKGDARSRIVEMAKQWASDLIVMGSRGHKGMDLILLGSVSQSVLMQAPCPVLIIKGREASEAVHGFKKVLIAADNSDYSQAALGWLKKMSWSADAQMKLITVLPPLSDSIADEHGARVSTMMLEQDELKSLAATQLQAMQKELADLVSPQNIFAEVAEGDPRELILLIASSWAADLIVMGSHGRTGLTKLLLGSVSQAVAQHADCSVAIVRGLLQKSKGFQQTGRFIKPAAKKKE